MVQIESITDYLKRKLREAGSARFEAIAIEANRRAGIPADSEQRVRVSFIRKFFYGDRENPRVQTVQPLLDYFAAVERGECQLPPPERHNEQRAA